ncbi:MAG: hypothetical protein HGA65_01495 [Oscillochloris sp.]|nr:hypothetical protein [Oscillochloris sp.]
MPLVAWGVGQIEEGRMDKLLAIISIVANTSLFTAPLITTLSVFIGAFSLFCSFAKRAWLVAGYISIVQTLLLTTSELLLLLSAANVPGYSFRLIQLSQIGRLYPLLPLIAAFLFSVSVALARKYQATTIIIFALVLQVTGTLLAIGSLNYILERVVG